MGKEKSSDNGAYSLEETERRRDEVVRHMANIPPRPRGPKPDRPRQKKKKTADEDRPARARGKP
jgi:hypothetical protein